MAKKAKINFKELVKKKLKKPEQKVSELTSMIIAHRKGDIRLPFSYGNRVIGKLNIDFDDLFKILKRSGK